MIEQNQPERRDMFLTDKEFKTLGNGFKSVYSFVSWPFRKVYSSSKNYLLPVASAVIGTAIGLGGYFSYKSYLESRLESNAIMSNIKQKSLEEETSDKEIEYNHISIRVNKDRKTKKINEKTYK